MTPEQAKEIVKKGKPHPQYECERLSEYHEAVGFLKGIEYKQKLETDEEK